MKRLFTTLMLIAILCVSFANISYAQQKSPAKAGLMSTVLPGLGQFYTNQSSKGLFLASTYVGVLGLIISGGPGTWEENDSNSPFSEFDTGTSGTVQSPWPVAF